MKLLAVLLIAITLSLIIAPTVNSTFAMGKKDAQAKKAIIQGIVRAAEGKWRSIDMVNISKVNSSSVITVYNKTVGPILPQPPSGNVTPPEPQVCNIKEHLENGICVPDVVIPPVVNNTGNETQLPACPAGFVLDKDNICVPILKPPVGPPVVNETTTTKVCLVGDLSGNTVPNLMRINGCDLKIGLGDLGYASTLSWFKSLDFTKCVIGNHDATEDGSASLYKEALAYCGDHWSLKINNSTLLLGFNTNGDTNTQVTAVKQYLQSSSGLKTVILTSHKGGHVPPNSHHPAEAASLYKQLEALIPSTVKLVEVYGHNHVLSSAPSNNWYQSGAGGKSHYTCGTDAVWSFCDNTHYGFLELDIHNDGNTTAKFIN